MDRMKAKRKKRLRRKVKVRARIKGTGKRPRLSVSKSNRHIYGQLIDDEKVNTLIRVSDLDVKKMKKLKKNDLAKETGKALAKKALEVKIKEVVFDRGGFKFHGRIKQFAEGAREGGLKF